jgi:hypothetical protein
MMALDIINPLGNHNTLRQARKVMSKGFHRRLGIAGPGAREMANQVFFFVSILPSGFPRLV